MQTLCLWGSFFFFSFYPENININTKTQCWWLSSYTGHYPDEYNDTAQQKFPGGLSTEETCTARSLCSKEHCSSPRAFYLSVWIQRMTFLLYILHQKHPRWNKPGVSMTHTLLVTPWPVCLINQRTDLLTCIRSASVFCGCVCAKIDSNTRHTKRQKEQTATKRESKKSKQTTQGKSAGWEQDWWGETAEPTNLHVLPELLVRTLPSKHGGRE